MGAGRTFTITKDFAFSASHVLGGLPEGHQCGRLHGHNYSVELELTSPELDAPGFVVDYGDLAVFKAVIDGRLDHRHLNDVLDVNPTAEHLACWLYGEALRVLPAGTVAAVRVMETPKTGAEYRP